MTAAATACASPIAASIGQRPARLPRGGELVVRPRWPSARRERGRARACLWGRAVPRATRRSPLPRRADVLPSRAARMRRRWPRVRAATADEHREPLLLSPVETVTIERSGLDQIPGKDLDPAQSCLRIAQVPRVASRLENLDRLRIPRRSLIELLLSQSHVPKNEKSGVPYQSSSAGSRSRSWASSSSSSARP